MLKEIRKSAGLTQVYAAKRLSEKLGRTIRQKDISRWEHGEIVSGLCSCCEFIPNI